MEIVAYWFWLLCGAWVGLVGAWDIQRRSQGLVAKGQVEVDAAHGFARQYALAITVPCVILWLLQRSIGADASPYFDQWPLWQRGAAYVLTTGLQLALFIWVWFRGGDQVLAKHLGWHLPFGLRGAGMTWKLVTAVAPLMNAYFLLFGNR